MAGWATQAETSFVDVNPYSVSKSNDASKIERMKRVIGSILPPVKSLAACGLPNRRERQEEARLQVPKTAL